MHLMQFSKTAKATKCGHICTVPCSQIYSTETENYSQLDPHIKCQFASLLVYLRGPWLYNGEHACIISCLSSCQEFASFTQPWANASKTGTARVFSCHVMQINSTHSATPLSPLLLYTGTNNVIYTHCTKSVIVLFCSRFFTYCVKFMLHVLIFLARGFFWQKVEEAAMCIILFLWSRVVFVCDPHGRPLIKEIWRWKHRPTENLFVP
jgi:hypothetical protein